MARTVDNSSTTTSTSAAMETAAIITEVSIRYPIQVIATSPGRSAIQAKPATMSVTDTRNRMIRIIRASSLPKRVRSFACQLTCSLERSLPGSGSFDPVLRWRTYCSVELGEISERTTNVGLRGFDFGPCQHGRLIVTRWRTDRANAHQLARIGLYPLQETPRRHLPARSFQHRRDQCGQLPPQSRCGRHAAGRKRCQQL